MLWGHNWLFPCMFITSLKTTEVYRHKHLQLPSKDMTWEEHLASMCLSFPPPPCAVPAPNTHNIQPSSPKNIPLSKPSIPYTHTAEHRILSRACLVLGYKELNFIASNITIKPKKRRWRGGTMCHPPCSALLSLGKSHLNSYIL